MRDVSEGQDIIDSRDVIKRIEKLEEERAALVEASTDGVTTGHTQQLLDAVDEWDNDEDGGVELKKLKALAEEGQRTSDWTHGVTLIADSYFTEYAQELAENIGAIQKDLAWPACHIDWEAAAEALKQDYFSVEYGSTTYWIRS